MSLGATSTLGLGFLVPLSRGDWEMLWDVGHGIGMWNRGSRAWGGNGTWRLAGSFSDVLGYGEWNGGRLGLERECSLVGIRITSNTWVRVYHPLLTNTTINEVSQLSSALLRTSHNTQHPHSRTSTLPFPHPGAQTAEPARFAVTLSSGISIPFSPRCISDANVL